MEEKCYIAMYDVRGIQEYVFRSNKLKEIIGASNIITNLFDDILDDVVKKVLNPKEYRLSWNSNIDSEKERLYFEKDETVKMEVIYSGGGNTFILYRGEDLYHKINRLLAKEILDKTYSLNLAMAVIEKTDNYSNDYLKLSREMAGIKAKMNMPRLTGNFSVTRRELSTGFPLAKKIKDYDKNVYLSEETYLKRKACKTTEEKEFDKMITQKGDQSLLAIVHIDGNNIGNRIVNLIKGEEDYSKAVFTMRTISKNINDAFNIKAFNSMQNALETWIASDSNEKLEKKNKDGATQKYMRQIINAGDDITFVCNATVALSLCKVFIDKLSECVMFGNALNTDDLKKYGFTACAGVAIIRSHFPFYEGYKVAEECCSSAKSRAKEFAKNRETAGSWIDFQICRNAMVSADLEKSRMKNYVLSDGTKLLLRPYAIKDENIKEYQTFESFIKNHNDFIELCKNKKNWVNALRNNYNIGQHETNLLYNKMISREIFLPNDKDKPNDIKEAQDYTNKLYTTDNTALYFDVLEMLELFNDITLTKEEEK